MKLKSTRKFGRYKAPYNPDIFNFLHTSKHKWQRETVTYYHCFTVKYWIH